MHLVEEEVNNVTTRYSGTIGGSMVNVGLLILGKANNATMANENDGLLP